MVSYTLVKSRGEIYIPHGHEDQPDEEMSPVLHTGFRARVVRTALPPAISASYEARRLEVVEGVAAETDFDWHGDGSAHGASEQHRGAGGADCTGPSN